MGSGWSVLVVEDNPGDVLLVARAFEEANACARLYGARDGEEALAMVHATEPDLVLLDLRLPRLGGLEVLAHLRGMPEYRDLPVVVLTSSPAEADRDGSLALGADRFITKPSTFDDLVTLVRELALRYRSRS